MNRDVAMETFIQITKYADKFINCSSDKFKDETIRYASKILGPMDTQNYLDFLDITTTDTCFWRPLFMAARNQYQLGKPSKSVELPEIPKQNLTLDEKRELEHQKMSKFFFKKNKTNPLCDCGAAHTSFPQVHQHSCSVNKNKDAVDLNFWD